MSVPDPYANRPFIVTVFTNADGTLAKTSDLTEQLPMNYVVCHMRSLFSQIDNNQPYLMGTLETAAEWEVPLAYIESLYEQDASTVLVGYHNKGVLLRAAWWSHLRNKKALTAFAHKSQNLDLVDSYNGPAIMTAEERYSFDIDHALSVLGMSGENLDDPIKKTWSLTQRLLEYKT